MESVTLKFKSIESLAIFIKTLESGYYANMPKLTIKGRFTPEAIEFARVSLDAENLILLA